jgi:hypothetical protein
MRDNADRNLIVPGGISALADLQLACQYRESTRSGQMLSIGACNPGEQRAFIEQGGEPYARGRSFLARA